MAPGGHPRQEPDGRGHQRRLRQRLQGVQRETPLQGEEGLRRQYKGAETGEISIFLNSRVS